MRTPTRYSKIKVQSEVAGRWRPAVPFNQLSSNCQFHLCEICIADRQGTTIYCASGLPLPAAQVKWAVSRPGQHLLSQVGSFWPGKMSCNVKSCPSRVHRMFPCTPTGRPACFEPNSLPNLAAQSDPSHLTSDRKPQGVPNVVSTSMTVWRS